MYKVLSRNEKPAVNVNKSKAYLSSVYCVYKEIELKKNQLMQLEYSAGGAGSVPTDLIKVQAMSKGNEILLCRAADLSERLNKQIVQLMRVYDEADRRIESLSDPAKVLVLKQKYLMFKSTEQIAEDMSYSSRHITRLIRGALEEFENKYFAKQ